jgi:predicted GIY-YIG superfamily endonuclease
MSVRKREWINKHGDVKSAWVADYHDGRRRRWKHFPTRKAAQAFHVEIAAQKLGIHQAKVRIPNKAPGKPLTMELPPGYPHTLMDVQVLPSVSGIYFLMYQGELMYVGQSENVGYRVSQHRNHKRRGFHIDEVHVLYCDVEDMNLLELHYHLTLHPKHGTVGRLRELQEAIKHKRRVLISADGRQHRRGVYAGPKPVKAEPEKRILNGRWHQRQRCESVTVAGNRRVLIDTV